MTTNSTSPREITVAIPVMSVEELRSWILQAVAIEDFDSERTARVVRAKEAVLGYSPPIYLTLSYKAAKYIADQEITPVALRSVLTEAVAEERERCVEARKEAYLGKPQ